MSDWQALVESASKEGVNWTHMEKKTTFREELTKPLRKMLSNFAPQHTVDVFLETYAEEYFDQIIELVKKEQQEALEKWKKQGRTEEQIWAVENFITGAGRVEKNEYCRAKDCQLYIHGGFHKKGITLCKYEINMK